MRITPKSRLSVSEQFGLIPELCVRRLEKTCRGWAPSRVVPRCDDAQTRPNEFRGRVTRRSGSFQCAYVLRVEANCGGNEPCHTFTIQRGDSGKTITPCTLPNVAAGRVLILFQNVRIPAFQPAEGSASAATRIALSCMLLFVSGRPTRCHRDASDQNLSQDGTVSWWVPSVRLIAPPWHWCHASFVSTSTSSATTWSCCSSAPVRTIGWKSGLSGLSLILV